MQHLPDEQNVLLDDVHFHSCGVQHIEMYEAIGGREGSREYEEFITKRQLLARKWESLEDSDRRRLVLNTLTDDTKILDPLCVAILADNVSYIEKYLGKTDADIDKENCLSMACIFGSRMVADRLMKELSIPTYKCKGGMLLADMCLSFNESWVKEIFVTQLQSKLPFLVDLTQVEENIKAVICKKSDSKLTNNYP